MFIIGTSGVGKSVTIKHLIGLLRIDAGEIWFDGARVDQLPERALAPLRKRIGMVFQNSTLFDSMTLAENVALPLRKHGRHAPRARARREAHDAARAGLHGRVRRSLSRPSSPTACASAPRSRARSRSSPEVVLFDEPTTGLDPVSARRVDRLIRELAEQARRHRDRRLARSAVDLRHRRPHRVPLPGRRPRRRHAGRAARVGRSDRPAVHHRPVDRPMETPGFSTSLRRAAR